MRNLKVEEKIAPVATEAELAVMEAEKEAKRFAEEEKVQAAANAAAALQAKKDEAAKMEAERVVKSQIVLAEIVPSTKRGPALTAFALGLFDHHGVAPTGTELLTALLPKIEIAKTKASWADPEEYGELLANLLYTADVKTSQLSALYAIQNFMHSIEFPKGLIESVFMALYQNDILDEDAFIAYKYDLDDETPGKMKAIIQTTQWLTWLETAAEEDEGDDEEDYNLDDPTPVLL